MGQHLQIDNAFSQCLVLEYLKAAVTYNKVQNRLNITLEQLQLMELQNPKKISANFLAVFSLLKKNKKMHNTVITLTNQEDQKPLCHCKSQVLVRQQTKVC
uniref:Uncharacterized protein n=1 Tax=Romanomermis culicivorax TaxID=13658 RepID=A0A915JYL6_ROMCU